MTEEYADVFLNFNSSIFFVSRHYQNYIHLYVILPNVSKQVSLFFDKGEGFVANKVIQINIYSAVSENFEEVTE